MKNTPSFRLNRLRSAMLLRGVPMLITCLAGAGQTHVAQAQQDNIDEIVVTGSRIEGVAPVGATVTVLDREAIENSGTVTLDRMIRELPQVFDLGFSENSRAQSGGNGNATYSNSVNLRGLSPFSTLIILDGHRMTTNGRAIDPSVLPTLGVERVEVIADGASAIYGSDAVAGVVNMIPRRNLDGVEVFARYAPTSDGDFHEWNTGIAFGKVFDRGQAMLAWDHAFRTNLSGDDRDFFTSDQTPFGGPDYRVNACSPGTMIYGGQTYALPAEYSAANANSLVAGSQNLCDSQHGQDLFPEQEYNSLLGTATFELNDNIEFLFDGYYAKREFVRNPGSVTNTFTVPESNAFFTAPDFYVPGSGGYRIAYNFANDTNFNKLKGYQENWQFTPGVRIELPNDWNFEAKVGYGEAEDRADAGQGLDARGALPRALASSDPATAFDPYGLGRTTASTLAGMFAAQTNFPTNSELTIYQAGFNGPLFDMPGGQARLAVGYDGQDFTMILGAGTNDVRTYDRTVDSTYAELLLPLVGPGNAMPGIQDLQLNAAVRYDKYSDVGSTTNPKVGINWVVNDTVKLRASYGTSFRAPTFPEIFGNSSRLYIQAYTNPNPNGPPKISGYTYGSGPNPDLGPEEATTWTIGADFNLLDNMRLSLTYFDIAYEDTISGLLSNLSVLTLADEYAGTDVILFGQPAYDRLNSLIAEGKPVLQFPGTSDACLSIPDPASCISVDGRSLNLGRSEMKGLDINLQHLMPFGADDTLIFQLNSSYLTDYNVAFTPGGPLVDQRNQIFNPMKLKWRGSVMWEHAPFTTRLQATHVNSYTNTLVNPNQSVDSYTLVDLAFTWQVSQSLQLGMVDGLSVTAEVRNLFDEDPPYVNVAPASNGSGGYDATNTNPVGRLLSLSVRSKF